jgi:hypothetical protein
VHMPLVPNSNLFMAPALPGKLPRQANGFEYSILGYLCAWANGSSDRRAARHEARQTSMTHKTTFSSRYALPNFRHSFIPARPDIGERSSVRDVVNGEESRLSALEATPRETCH